MSASYDVSFDEVFPDICYDIDWPEDVEGACNTEGGSVYLTNEDRAKVNEAYDLIALAIAAFEASPESNAFTSKYDYSLKGMAKLSKKESKGFALFHGKAKCFKCHIIQGKKPLLTVIATFDS